MPQWDSDFPFYHSDIIIQGFQTDSRGQKTGTALALYVANSSSIPAGSPELHQSQELALSTAGCGPNSNKTEQTWIPNLSGAGWPSGQKTSKDCMV